MKLNLFLAFSFFDLCTHRESCARHSRRLGHKNKTGTLFSKESIARMFLKFLKLLKVINLTINQLYLTKITLNKK